MITEKHNLKNEMERRKYTYYYSQTITTESNFGIK